MCIRDRANRVPRRDGSCLNYMEASGNILPCLLRDIVGASRNQTVSYTHLVESSSENVHQAFDQALNDSLCMQDDLYKKMSAKGWYQMEQAEQEKIQKVKNKFAGM